MLIRGVWNSVRIGVVNKEDSVCLEALYQAAHTQHVFIKQATSTFLLMLVTLEPGNQRLVFVSKLMKVAPLKYSFMHSVQFSEELVVYDRRGLKMTRGNETLLLFSVCLCMSSADGRRRNVIKIVLMEISRTHKQLHVAARRYCWLHLLALSHCVTAGEQQHCTDGYVV